MSIMKQRETMNMESKNKICVVKKHKITKKLAIHWKEVVQTSQLFSFLLMPCQFKMDRDDGQESYH